MRVHVCVCVSEPKMSFNFKKKPCAALRLTRRWWVRKARDSDLYVSESLKEALAKVWHQTRQFIPPTSIHLVQATALRRRQSAACRCRSPLSSESQVSEKYSFCRSTDAVLSEDLIRTLSMCVAPTAQSSHPFPKCKLGAMITKYTDEQ